MIKIHERLIEEGFISKLILQVHDELVFDAVPGELDQLKEMVHFEMENAIKLDVPLIVESNSGENWLVAH